VVRTQGLFGAAGVNFVAKMLELARERDTVTVVHDQRSAPTYVGHLAEALRAVVELPPGVWHVAADGDCTWAELAEAIFEESALECRVRRISSSEFGARAVRPANSVLRSEKGAPVLPHWREGLRACLEALGAPAP
jgi:dTDP-4-dehydrorhamnose reductase